MTEPAYTYRAKLRRVIDGDTFVADIDLGFYCSIAIKVRLNGVNAPERGTEAGKAAIRWLRNALAEQQLLVRSYKDQRSFERWVCDVWLPDGANLAARLIATEHGEAA